MIRDGAGGKLRGVTLPTMVSLVRPVAALNNTDECGMSNAQLCRASSSKHTKLASRDRRSDSQLWRARCVSALICEMAGRYWFDRILTSKVHSYVSDLRQMCKGIKGAVRVLLLAVFPPRLRNWMLAVEEEGKGGGGGGFVVYSLTHSKVKVLWRTNAFPARPACPFCKERTPTG